MNLGKALTTSRSSPPLVYSRAEQWRWEVRSKSRRPENSDSLSTLNSWVQSTYIYWVINISCYWWSSVTCLVIKATLLNMYRMMRDIGIKKVQEYKKYFNSYSEGFVFKFGLQRQLVKARAWVFQVFFWKLSHRCCISSQVKVCLLYTWRLFKVPVAITTLIFLYYF